MPGLFTKLRGKKSKYSTSKKPTASVSSKSTSRKSSIFRRNKKNEKPEDNFPMIQPGITWTLSEDETEGVTEEEQQQSTEIIHQHPATTARDEMKKPEVMTFTLQEVAQNHLNHIRVVAEKEQEIVKQKQINQELVEEFNKKTVQLRAYYQNKVEEQETRIILLESELKAAKENLKRTACALLQTQHELHESKTARTSWLPQAWLSN